MRQALWLSKVIPLTKCSSAVQGGEAKWNRLDSLNFKDGTKSPGRARWLELIGLTDGEERAAQRESPGDVHSVPFKYIYMWESAQGHRENYP